MTQRELGELLVRPEGDTLDFKEKPYEFSTNGQKAKFVKDIISMANTPREGDAHIVIGVRKKTDGSFEVVGVGQHLDEAELQRQLRNRVHPVPTFRYEPSIIEGKSIGVIVIPPRRGSPCFPVRDFGGVLLQHALYFRRGSTNDVAAPDEQQRIWQWFASKSGGESARPGLVFQRQEGGSRTANIGDAAAVNGHYETSYRETNSHSAHFGRPSRRASANGRLQPLAPGDIHPHEAYFHERLKVILTYGDADGRRYWSRYCPVEGWRFGEGHVAPGDFGCTCKLSEKGYVEE